MIFNSLLGRRTRETPPAHPYDVIHPDALLAEPSLHVPQVNLHQVPDCLHPEFIRYSSTQLATQIANVGEGSIF